jgi:glutaredoxin-related protein
MANTKPVVSTATTKAKPAPKKVEAPKKEKPKHWLKDDHNKKKWVVFSVPHCDLTPKALQILRDHGEVVNHQVYSQGSAQAALSKGHNFSPCIYANGQLIGSLGDLETYYKRNFFSSILQGIE